MRKIMGEEKRENQYCERSPPSGRVQLIRDFSHASLLIELPSRPTCIPQNSCSLISQARRYRNYDTKPNSESGAAILMWLIGILG
jgi:hypothetical protein